MKRRCQFGVEYASSRKKNRHFKYAENSNYNCISPVSQSSTANYSLYLALDFPLFVCLHLQASHGAKTAVLLLYRRIKLSVCGNLVFSRRLIVCYVTSPIIWKTRKNSNDLNWQHYIYWLTYTQCYFIKTKKRHLVRVCMFLCHVSEYIRHVALTRKVIDRRIWRTSTAKKCYKYIFEIDTEFEMYISLLKKKGKKIRKKKHIWNTHC